MKQVTKRIGLPAMLVFGIGAAMAQEQPQIDHLCTTGDNWYIEASAGTQMLFAKDADALDFKDRLTPFVSLSVGRWFSPWAGFRVQGQGYGLNGNSTTEGLFTADRLPIIIYGQNDPVREYVGIRPDGSYRYNTRYFNIHADFRTSLANLIAPGKNHRFDVIPSAGLGWYRQLGYKGTPNVNSISANFSAMLKFAVWKGLDLNLEASAAVLPDAFDGRIAGRQYENNLALALGLTWNFGRKSFKKKPERVEVIREVTKYVRDTVTIVKVKEVAKSKTVESRKEFALATILFPFDSAKPKQGQDVMYSNIANYLQQNPDATLRLDGYADEGTGTPDYNRRLSVRRADAVRKIMMEQYGIPSSRMEAQGIGINSQPYDRGWKNRAVVVIVPPTE